ncbi:MAG: hypothetical protein JNN30_03645, partial [Rhodanobacteraceae bacterium]|nr:hypothetical protein [Rhodanobacteraceae bacterium]
MLKVFRCVSASMLLAGSAVAAEPAATRAADAQIKAHVDRESGQLVQSSENPAAEHSTNAQFTSDPSKVTMEVTEKGRLYHLNGQAESAVVAHVGADGKVHIGCNDAADSVAHQQEVRDER